MLLQLRSILASLPFLLFACGGGHGGHVAADGGAAQADAGAPQADGGAAAADGGVASNVLASLPNPAVVVAGGGTGQLVVIDPASLTVSGRLAVAAGLYPHHLSVSPDNARLLLSATSADLSAGHGGGGGHGGHGTNARSSVYELSATTRELRKVLDVAATAHNAAFTPDGNTIVLAMSEHGMISAYDAATFDERFSVTGLSAPLEVTPTGAGLVLVAESGAGRIAHVSLSSRSVVTRTNVGETPVAAWASGGNDYFVSVEGAKRVWHFQQGSTAVSADTHQIDPRVVPGQVRVRPGASAEVWVAVEDRGVIALFHPTTHAAIAEIAAGTKPHGIVFTPTGDRAFVTDEGTGKVLVIDAATRTLVREIDVGAKPNGIVWFAR